MVTGFHLKVMPKRTGRPYEKLAQQIFAEVLNRDEVRSVEVKHDVTLTGRTTDHQIDVYFSHRHLYFQLSPLSDLPSSPSTNPFIFSLALTNSN